MSSRKQRLDVGPSSSPSSSTDTTNKPRKRRFDEASDTDPFNNQKQKEPPSMSQTNSSINRFTNQSYSHQYNELFKKRRQLPVWEYKDAFMATIERNQVSWNRSERTVASRMSLCLGHCPRR